jgi:hypothetical protein
VSGTREASGYRYRSLFWPVVLVGVGVVWLLVNLGVMGGVSAAVVVRMWPLLLVGIGLDLLFGHRSPLLGGVVGVVTVGIGVALLLVAPTLAWTKSAELRTDTFAEPVGVAVSADVRLDLTSAESRVFVLATDASELVRADVRHYGEIELRSQESKNASGGSLKTVTLRQTSSGGSWFGFLWRRVDKESWNVGLTPRIRMDLAVNVGSGPARLELQQLDLNTLSLRGGSGSLEAELPAGLLRLPVSLHSGSGSARLATGGSGAVVLTADTGSGSVVVTQGKGSNLEVELSAGSGGVRFEMPSGQGLRVEVRDSGSGSVRLPSGLTEVERGEGDRGVWESPGYASASNHLLLAVEGVGSGSIEVRTVD